MTVFLLLRRREGKLLGVILCTEDFPRPPYACVDRLYMCANGEAHNSPSCEYIGNASSAGLRLSRGGLCLTMSTLTPQIIAELIQEAEVM